MRPIPRCLRKPSPGVRERRPATRGCARTLRLSSMRSGKERGEPCLSMMKHWPLPCATKPYCLTAPGSAGHPGHDQ